MEGGLECDEAPCGCCLVALHLWRRVWRLYSHQGPAALPPAARKEHQASNSLPMLPLPAQVCRLANVDNLSFAANVDCSIVAWSEACHVFVRFMGAGLSERPARLPVPARFGGGGAPVVAMQWSPDGRKLLMLALNGGWPGQLTVQEVFGGVQGQRPGVQGWHLAVELHTSFAQLANRLCRTFPCQRKPAPELSPAPVGLQAMTGSGWCGMLPQRPRARTTTTLCLQALRLRRARWARSCCAPPTSPLLPSNPNTCLSSINLHSRCGCGARGAMPSATRRWTPRTVSRGGECMGGHGVGCGEGLGGGHGMTGQRTAGCRGEGSWHCSSCFTPQAPGQHLPRPTLLLS